MVREQTTLGAVLRNPMVRIGFIVGLGLAYVDGCTELWGLELATRDAQVSSRSAVVVEPSPVST